MGARVTPYESLYDRVDKLVCAHSEVWPPLHSTTTHSAIAELIARVDGLEQALHVMALEIQSLESEQDGIEAHTQDD